MSEDDLGLMILSMGFSGAIVISGSISTSSGNISPEDELEMMDSIGGGMKLGVGGG
jgi:hypothetical protein